MSTNPFEELIADLGKLLDTPLRVDENNVCLLEINETYQVQFEMGPRNERIVMGTFIAELPPGKFRENVLAEALKANQNYPRIGTLGYTKSNNCLTLHLFTPIAHATPEKLKEELEEFINKVSAWKSAIEAGNPSPENKGGGSLTGPSIFDIKL